MATSEVSICNLAISWLGGNQISALDEETVEATLCNANYDTVRDFVLESRDWTFAATRDTLTPLVAAPDFEFTYQFQLPSDLIRLTMVDSIATLNYGENWVREGAVILADVDTLYVKYIKRETDPTKFSPGFVQCLAARIAANIASPLTGSKALKDEMEALYGALLETGGAMDGMQGKNIPLRSNRLINVR